ncbi:DNA-binding transcriptional regulator, PucR family [Brevibacterium sp. 239c]|nr:DNA-binding transcriptional regulator, PucR family [Brevibacterium sp. 239c]
MPPGEPIQELIEQIAQTLQRSVAVDDPDLVLIGSSTHFEDVDEARLSSLVGRKITGRIRDHVLGRGAKSWKELTVVPAYPEIGMTQDRLCFPLRSRYELLGFMWVLGQSITDDERRIALDGAEHIRQALARQTQSMTESRAESEALLSDVLSPRMDTRSRAAQSMRERGMFAEAKSFVVLSVIIGEKSRSEFGEPPVDIVREAFLKASQGRWRSSCASADLDSEFTVLLGSRTSIPPADSHSLAESIHREIERLDRRIADAMVIGIGANQPNLETARESHAQASIAVKVGRARALSVVAWADHPADALIAALLKDEPESSLIPPALRELNETQRESTLLLVEAFLNHAGNAVRTAEDMGIHRTTVYYRIDRFEATTGLDLNDGSTRFLLQFWLGSRHFRHDSPPK